MTRVLFHTNSSWGLLNLRMPIMKAMQALGFEVGACGPRDEHTAGIEANGIQYFDVPINVGGTNPWVEAKVVRRLSTIYRRTRPAAVHHFGLKPCIYGSLAARAASISCVINTVTGLGIAFSRPSLLQQEIKLLLWRLACKRRAWSTFQNPDDLATMVRLGLVHANRTQLILGSGVNTEKFRCGPPPSTQDGGRTLTFLMFGRMLWSKGVREFCEAATAARRQLAGQGNPIHLRFLLVGGALEGNPTGVLREFLDNPDAIPVTWLQQLAQEGVVEHRPHDYNILPYLQQSDVVVLPTYYPEGLPDSLIEALSCGRAIITTDTPGCREVVPTDENGILVPVRDVNALARAFVSLACDPARIAKMGAASRRLALDLFANRHVIRATLSLYSRAGLALPAKRDLPLSACASDAP